MGAAGGGGQPSRPDGVGLGLQIPGIVGQLADVVATEGVKDIDQRITGLELGELAILEDEGFTGGHGFISDGALGQHALPRPGR